LLVEDLKRKYPAWIVSDIYWWERTKRKCTCRLCGGIIKKDERRLVVIVECFTHRLLLMMREKPGYGFDRILYFCGRHSEEEILSILYEHPSP